PQYTYAPYMYSVETGPFIKHELYERTNITLEVNFRPQHFYSDDSLTPAQQATSARSGMAITPRATLKLDTGSTYFSPQGSVSYEMNNTQGLDQISRTLSLDFSNPIQVPPGYIVTVSVNAAFASYPQYSNGAGRSDTLLGLRASFVKD